MTITLNLAGKPFTNRALPWIVTALVVFVSLVAFVLIIRSTGQARAQSQLVQKDINDLKQQEQKFQKQTKEIRDSLTDEQKQTLMAAHALVDRKGFSWSRLLADLESALPGTVRVTRISVRNIVRRGDQTVAELDLVVISKASSTITEMIGEMDRAGIFQAELKSQSLQKGRGETGTEFELNVVYRPRAGAASSNDINAVAKTGNSMPGSQGEPR